MYPSHDILLMALGAMQACCLRVHALIIIVSTIINPPFTPFLVFRLTLTQGPL